MRIGRRVVKALVWGLVLSLSILGGGLWFAFWYMTDGETVAQIIREGAVPYFPGSTLDPGRVHISMYGGKVEFHQVSLTQRIDGAPFQVLHIPWLNIRINTQKLAQGRLEAREVVVSHPTLRLRHRRDGTWNLDGLLANPWPGPWIETPPITIQNATLELIPDEEPTSSALTPKESARTSQTLGAPVISVSGTGAEVGESRLPSPWIAPAPTRGAANRNTAILRDVSLNIKEAEGNPDALEFEGTARGDAFEKMQLKGTIDLIKGNISLEGELSGLTLSEMLRRRVPREARPAVKALALNSGVVDLELKRFRYDPTAAPARRLSYQAQARIREGVWECPKLPFPVNELSALIGVEDGVLSIKHAQGSNGLTSLRARRNDRTGRPSAIAAGPADRPDRPRARSAAA